MVSILTFRFLKLEARKCLYGRLGPYYPHRARTRRVCVKCVASAMHWRSFGSHFWVIWAKPLIERAFSWSWLGGWSRSEGGI